METISIILPYYQNKKTIERCIESILDQTYPHFQLLAVSDGSTDGTADIVRRYALMDSRVVPLFPQHGGVSHARNVGLAEASGDYIQFVDADDYLEPTMLERMLAALRAADADICSCAFTHPCLGSYVGNQVFDFGDPAEIYAYYQHTFAGHVPWNKLYRRGVITTPFIEGLPFCEDGMFGIANMFGARRVVTIGDALYHYCVAPPDGEKSCITGMAAAPFWETYDTIWYLRRALSDTARSVFEQHLPADEVERFTCVRLFDFLIWELIVYLANGAPQAGTAKEIERVLLEEDFQRSVAVKRGVQLRALTAAERRARVAQWVSAAADFFAQSTGELRPYVVCLQLFAALFLESAGDPDGREELAVLALDELRENRTPEARYVNDVLRRMETATLSA